MGSFSRDGLVYWLSDQESEKMLGDQFGLKKIIVIATENGKVSAQTQTITHGVTKLVTLSLFIR